MHYIPKKICAAALVALTFAATGRAADTPQPVLMANVMGANSWGDIDKAPYGMYSMSLSAQAGMTLVSHSVVPANFGAVYVDGRYFVANGIATGIGNFITNYVYDAYTWTKISDFPAQDVDAWDLTWDRSTGLVYGVFYTFGTSAPYFGTIDIDTGLTTRISEPGLTILGLAADIDGSMYAISREGVLYSVDKERGTFTPVGDTGCVGQYDSSAAIDAVSGLFYYVTCTDAGSTLYAIDTATARATKLYDLPDGEEVRGMYFSGPQARPGAPASVTGLAAGFVADALEGTLSFAMPTGLFDGTPAEGSVDCIVRLDGEVVKSMKADYGADVSLPVSVAAAGMHTFTVALTNSAGAAPVASLRLWVGRDVPAVPAGLTLDYDGHGRFTVSWQPAVAAHGGWIDLSDVTYTLCRRGESEAEFAGLTATSYTDVVPEPADDEYATYYYTLVARCSGVSSSMSISDSYTIGYVNPPFAESFDQRWSLGRFTIFEGDRSDGQRWFWEAKAVHLDTSGSGASDDYLVLPPVMFEAGKTYTLSFDAKAKYDSDTESIEVLSGRGNTLSALTDIIGPAIEIRGTDFAKHEVHFTPDATASRFVALHAVSGPYCGRLSVDNLHIYENVAAAGDITADSARLTATPGAGSIRLDGCGTADIYDLTGVRLASVRVDGSACLPLHRGIYIVACGEAVYRLAVK